MGINQASSLAADQTEVEIETTAVNTDSKVFVTSTTTTDKVLSVIEKISGEKFKVKIASPSAAPIDFNWWVVN